MILVFVTRRSVLEICEIGEQGVLVAGSTCLAGLLTGTGWAAANSLTSLMNSRL